MNFGPAPSNSQASIFGTHGGSQSTQFGDLSQLPGSSPFGSGQALAEASAQALDQNSPELLKENIKRVQTHVELVRSLALATQHAIEKAYSEGMNPAQATESMQALRQAIISLQELLVSSGVGALPLLPEGASTPTEAQLLEMTTKAHNQVWTSRSRSQDASAVVANILSMPDRAQRQ
ncbi:hypothetical protein PENSPDRAFT_748938 [Peniophora sp. CONT]|nr:hypothetical protein PENSPDRAFT_748938 [Peniophora sp. CONT]